MRCQVDIYVKVPGDTAQVAVEGTIAEGVDHGVIFLLGDLAVHGQSGYIMYSAGQIGEDEVPQQIIKEWEEAEDLEQEPSKP